MSINLASGLLPHWLHTPHQAPTHGAIIEPELSHYWRKLRSIVARSLRMVVVLVVIVVRAILGREDDYA